MAKVLLGIWGLLLTAPLCAGADFPAPSGRFTFDGQPYVGTATLTNTFVRNKSLYVNGAYFTHDGNPCTAVFRPLRFDYQQFTVVVKLQPEVISQKTLFVGGTHCRWFALRTDKTGGVELALNNFDFTNAVKSLVVTNGQWITLAISVNIPSKTVMIYADGNEVEKVQLPPDFKLDILNDPKWKEWDNVITFTDYSNGNTFAGLVAGVLIFDTVLSPEQVRRLFPRN